ncbi:MAG TPA: hypothetical protein VJ732_14950 [Bryobacteraceae bacterium]|nr:hypothetical protein [Bryobacteraceae bacterium]
MQFITPLRMFLLAAWISGPVMACSCTVSLGCQQPPDPNNPDAAIFIGRVTEFYPASRAEKDQKVQEFYRSHQDLIRQIQNGSNQAARRRAGQQAGNLDFRKEMIEYLWGDALTEKEQEQLRTANESELNLLRFDYRRRARLDVIENFAAAAGPQFELYTSLDGPSCGFDFKVGETYLVYAYRNPGDEHWRVSSCSRTHRLADAEESVLFLRNWQIGVIPPPQIRGVSSPGIRVRLLGGSQPVETVVDGAARFTFLNLQPGKYEIETETAPPTRRAIDLTKTSCAEVVLPVSVPPAR